MMWASKLCVISDLKNKKDEEIVAIALEDADSFLILMQRYEQKLMAYIQRLGRFSVEDAEDVLQEVFLRVYQNLNGFDKSLKFSSWIYRITHNQAISAFRKKKRRPEQLNSEDSEKIFEMMADELDLEEELRRKMEAEKVQKVMGELDKKYRDVLVLKFLEGKDYKEISDILKKPMGTVATLINRAKEKLKKLLIKNKLIS